MQDVNADEIGRGDSPPSHRRYETVVVDSLSRRVAERLRSHEHAYEKLGQELGDVFEEAQEAARRLIADAEAEAEQIRDKSLADAAGIREDAEADAARLRDEAEREAAKTRRAAERDAARSKKEAGGRVRHLKKLEKETRERLTSLHQELLTLSEMVQQLEPPPLQEDDETSDEATGGGDAEPSVEKETAGDEYERARADTLPLRLSDESGARKPDAGGSNERERAGHHEDEKGVAASLPQGIGASAPHPAAATQSAARAPSIPPAPVAPSGAAPRSDFGFQGQGHAVAPAAEVRTAPAYRSQEPLDVLWAALGAFSCLFGIVGFLVGLAITLFDQGGFVGPLLALVSFGVLGLGVWAIKTHVLPALPGLFRTTSNRPANPPSANPDVRAGWQM